MDWYIESFKGTLAFARLAIVLLFLACLLGEVQLGVCAAILCAASSYASQTFFTQDSLKGGYLFQLVALACWVVGFLALILAPH